MSDLLQPNSGGAKGSASIESGMSEHPLLQLTCGICKSRYTDPRLLPCLHSFCNLCIKTLDSFILQGSTARESNRNAIILCPTCNTESAQPSSANGEFPVDFLLQKALLYDSFDSHNDNLTCELCTDDAKAVSRCIECMVNICGFCCQAHKRQKKTANHNVVSFLEARRRSYQQLQCPVHCPKHQQEELKFYCETCDYSVCRDCCLVEHREHLVEYVDDVGAHHKKVLNSLLSRLEPHIVAVKEGIDASDKLEVSIAERATSIEVDIHQYFEDYIKALHKHKRTLLQNVTQISASRTKAVQSQKLQFQQILGDLQHTYEITSTALQDGNNTEILSIKPTLSQRLCDLLRISYQSPPFLQQASIQFKAKSLSESNNPFNIRGVISTCMADAGKSYADGEGLRRARVGEETIVSVTVLDDAGHLIGDGGDDIQADIYSVDDIKKKFQCYVQDRGDGTYKLSYCLKELGSYILNVRVSGHHIKDSPFSLSVRTPWKSHTGMWHCCTFCSSEGNKDVTCACGGTMPGGFRGCGHNHIGHPGSWHWSCCASLDQDSVCSSKEPITRSASQDNIVSMKGMLQRRATLAHADRIRMLQQHQQGMVGSVRSDKPLRVRDHSPRRLRDPSPMRARDPSPMRFRDPSPMRFRDPSPMRSDTVDRYQYIQSQYAHSATGSPSLNIDARSWKNVSF